MCLWGISDLDAALRLLHPPDESLVVGKLTALVEGAREALPPSPTKANWADNRVRPDPPYTVVCNAFPQEPALHPNLPAGHSLAAWLIPPDPVPSSFQNEGSPS